MVNPDKFIEEKVAEIKKEVGGKTAVAAVSGGVDSSTTALLAYQALKDRLKVVFLDDGLMREGEAKSVAETLGSVGIDVKVYSVQEAFFRALKGLTDPEAKRKAFRETFYQTLARIVKELGGSYLLQGTIAADVVETVKGVKTQHNVLEQLGINPEEKYGFKVIEPLKELYKHEVRQVAKRLRLRIETVERRPFPGPGLAIRVLGEVTPEKVEVIRKATRIVEEETIGLPCFQAFAVLMNDRATGLTNKGERKYGNIIVLRIVESQDAMTAKPIRIPLKRLEKVAEKITGTIPSVVRVLYDLTSKPPATIEFE